MRFCEMQAWPEFMSAEKTMVPPAVERSASSRTIAALLPPSSSEQRVRFSAAILAMCLPTPVEPVKEILSIWGCETRWSPTELGPVTTDSTPSGRPASRNRSASHSAESGVADDGLSTTELPDSSAGPSLAALRYRGTFHAVMAATTPTGWRVTTDEPYSP